MSMTINEALVLQKAVRERLNELKGLRGQVATRERYFSMGNENRVTEPQYDVKAVDRKIVELEIFLLKSETAVKNANATTKLAIEFDTEKLLAPIE